MEQCEYPAMSALHSLQGKPPDVCVFSTPHKMHGRVAIKIDNHNVESVLVNVTDACKHGTLLVVDIYVITQITLLRALQGTQCLTCASVRGINGHPNLR